MSDQTPAADEPTPAEASSAEVTPVVPPAPPAQWPSSPQPGEGVAPVAGAPVAYVPAPPTSTNAIIAFVLSIISWAVCPIVPAIVALVLAASAQREIAVGQGRVQGGGLVTAAKIISWINIGFWAAILVIGGFFLALALVAGAA